MIIIIMVVVFMILIVEDWHTIDNYIIRVRSQDGAINAQIGTTIFKVFSKAICSSVFFYYF